MRFHHSSFGSDVYFQLLSFSSFVHSFDKGNLLNRLGFILLLNAALDQLWMFDFWTSPWNSFAAELLNTALPQQKWRFWRDDFYDFLRDDTNSTCQVSAVSLTACHLRLRYVTMFRPSQDHQTPPWERHLGPRASYGIRDLALQFWLCNSANSDSLVLLERLHEHLEISNQLGDTCKHIQRTKSYHLKNSTCQLQLSTRFQQHSLWTHLRNEERNW